VSNKIDKGQIKNGANSIALVKDHDLTLPAEMYDITAMGGSSGSPAKVFIPGLLDATVKVNATYDFTDTNGQLALFNAWLNGTLLTMTVSPNGTNNFSITAYVKQIDVKTAVNAADSVAFDLQCTGAVSYA
jgi:hypothetical protein